MFHVVLLEPEIPPNTGNIIRLCANTGAHLHLVKPLGFTLEDKQLRRAGLDYREWADMRVHDTLQECLLSLGQPRVWAFTTRASRQFGEVAFSPGDVFLFGAETRGLPEAVLAALPVERRLRLPMREGSRSLNLSNTVAVVVYEAWRQAGYAEGG